MPRRPPPAGDLLTWKHRPVAHRLGLRASRERPIPAPKETEAQRAWVAELRRTRLLKPNWRMTRPSGGDVADAKWAGVQYAMGMDPGWSDLIFASPRNTMMGVPAKLHAMEWKRGPGEDLRDEQQAMRRWFIENGWDWVTVWDATGAWKALQSWGALRMEIKF